MLSHGCQFVVGGDNGMVAVTGRARAASSVKDERAFLSRRHFTSAPYCFATSKGHFKSLPMYWNDAVCLMKALAAAAEPSTALACEASRLIRWKMCLSKKMCDGFRWNKHVMRQP